MHVELMNMAIGMDLQRLGEYQESSDEFGDTLRNAGDIPRFGDYLGQNRLLGQPATSIGHT